MFELSPLTSETLFRVGPVPISNAVATTWGIMGFLALFCFFGMRRPQIAPSGLQGFLEITVEVVARQISEILKRDPWPFLPLIGTIFIFLFVANLASIIPDLYPPTSHIETPAALAVIVFFSVHVIGVNSRGFFPYLRRYLEPNPFLAPINLLSEITRTFSLMVRLFGNMMSHELVIAIVILLAGLFVPIPFMLLGLMIGVIQAYIFSVLATVFIGAAIGATDERRRNEGR